MFDFRKKMDIETCWNHAFLLSSGSFFFLILFKYVLSENAGF